MYAERPLSPAKLDCDLSSQVRVARDNDAAAGPRRHMGAQWDGSAWQQLDEVFHL